ncbi:hypothetical protein LS73_007605 [Helicobacter muridarum]|uniref:Lipopolysaccharide heptosyltransferase family protein n=1 Tax=Helicobacter muridarum TaxID=216 RepID=A0A099TXX0_9HELI|nr:glycosyltransferase family 9 protein [Helicobacter muridarum]TLD99274.1 hypothetical protein LS73_007605 [Helicobacter muridarum]STQ86136.1 Uncharacterised protein [Helicobacter muridarum]
MVVGFIHHYGLGDNINCFQALYECKKFYNCHLIVFGNALMKRLLQYCSFVDDVVDIHILTKESALHIKEYNCDYLILTNAKGGYIRDLAACDTQVITGIKISSLIASYCRTIPICSLAIYRRMSNAERISMLVREINPSIYDCHKQIECMGLQPILELCRIQTSLEHKANITSFLQKTMVECSSYLYLIAINPFNIASKYTLPQSAWLKLIQIIARIPYCRVLVITYPAVHDGFMKQMQQFSDTLDSEITIFKNNDDVLNLVEMLSRVSLLISPSTGPIHIASNLAIPTLGVFSKKDTIKWATRDKRYVVVDCESLELELDSNKSDVIIKQIVQNVESLLAINSLPRFIFPNTKK